MVFSIQKVDDKKEALSPISITLFTSRTLSVKVPTPHRPRSISFPHGHARPNCTPSASFGPFTCQCLNVVGSHPIILPFFPKNRLVDSSLAINTNERKNFCIKKEKISRTHFVRIPIPPSSSSLSALKLGGCRFFIIWSPSVAACDESPFSPPLHPQSCPVRGVEGEVGQGGRGRAH